MNKPEAKAKMIAALDDMAKGAITLVISALVANAVEHAYDAFIVSRRNPVDIGDVNAQA